MTPCSECGQHHFAADCHGDYELADWELPGCDCPLCGAPMNETDRTCHQCRREGARLARQCVMPALALARKLYPGLLDSGSDTVIAVSGESLGEYSSARRVTERGSVPASEQTDGSGNQHPTIYDTITRIGALALPIALGSLAPLAAMLAGM